MKSPLLAKKSVKIRTLPAQEQPGRGNSTLWQERESGVMKYREFSSSCGHPAALFYRDLYNLFIAADEKIPLSVVQVNIKPQYLVFGWHSRHLFPKHGQLAVETAKPPCET
jgi:hypothetical protein